MLCQLVDVFSVERASVLDSYRKLFWKSNDSYRRLFWKSNKDAVSASWRFFGRACERKIRYEKLIFDTYFAEKSIASH